MHRYLCSLRSISKMLLAQKQGIKLMLHRGREVRTEVQAETLPPLQLWARTGTRDPARGYKEASAFTLCWAWLPGPDQPLSLESCNKRPFLDLQSRSLKRPPELLV